MKKLHKKLEKVAEHIDLSNANQTGKLKELAIACQHYGLAAELRGYERTAEHNLAEDSKFNPRQVLHSLTPLDKLLERSGWKMFKAVPTDKEKQVESLLDTLETNSESLNSKVDNLIEKLQSQSNSTLSAADVVQIGEWLSSTCKKVSLLPILGDDDDIEKTIDRGLAITIEVLKQGIEMQKSQEDPARDKFSRSVKKLMEEEPELLVNSIKTPDGTVLTSRHRHDYVCHKDSVTDTTFCIDGGDFYRRIVPGGVYQDLSVYSDDPFEKIRESLSRLGRGKSFDQPAQWYALKDMNDNWLAELIPWIEDNQPSNKYKKYYLQEIEYRKANGITVKEEEEC